MLLWSKSTIKTPPELSHAVFIFIFEHIQQLTLFLFIVNFEHVFVSWTHDKIHKTT